MRRSEELSLRAAAGPTHPRAWLAQIGRLFPRNSAIDLAATVVTLRVAPEAAWERIAFYEEVQRRPSALLRWFLPVPVRTEGDKMRMGALVRCTYDGGHLIKRITTVTPPHLVRFEVLDQRLGIEDCITMSDGAYAIRPRETGCAITLTTRYRGHLRPRWLWRPLERYVAHQVHRHILDGMRDAIAGPVNEAR